MSTIPSFVRNAGARSRQLRRQPGEAIDVRRKRFGFFPDVFVSRGHRYQVHTVERTWTVWRMGRGGRVARHCFRVRCHEGTFELYQDVQHNTWHLQRQVV